MHTTEKTKEGASAKVGVDSGEPPAGFGKRKKKGLDNEPKHDSSLLKALHSVFWIQFWLAGLLKFVSGVLSLDCLVAGPFHSRLLVVDTLNTTTPLVNQVLLTWLTNSYIYFRASEDERTTLGLQKPQGIGYGIGLAFAIFVMQGAWLFVLILHGLI